MIVVVFGIAKKKEDMTWLDCGKLLVPLHGKTVRLPLEDATFCTVPFDAKVLCLREKLGVFCVLRFG